MQQKEILWFQQRLRLYFSVSVIVIVVFLDIQYPEEAHQQDAPVDPASPVSGVRSEVRGGLRVTVPHQEPSLRRQGVPVRPLSVRHGQQSNVLL